MKKSTRRSRRHRNPQSKEDNKKPFFSKANDTSVQTKADQPFFQTKLTVGQPGDKYEQEADAVADAVVNKNNLPSEQAGNTPTIQQKEISSIQRYATNAKEDELGTNTQRIEKDKMIQEKPIQRMEGEEEEPVQMMEEEEEAVQAKEEEEPVQMMEEEEEAVQAKSNSTANNSASPQVAKQLKQSKGGGSVLPKSTRAEMENSFGVDFSQVKIHTNENSVQMNKELGAQAFTHGKDVYFNNGKFSPASKEGKKLLAHELTHVVQQNGDLKSINLKGDSIIQRQENTTQEEPEEENSTGALWHRAEKSFSNEEYENAITLFQQAAHTDEFAASSNENQSLVYYNIALTNMQLRRVAAANYYFELYQESHPDNQEVAAQIAHARRGMGMEPNSGTGAVEVDRDRAGLFYRRANIYYENGNYINAIILFERARILGDLPPQMEADLLYNIGNAHLRLGRYANAISYFEQYLIENPDDTHARNLLAAAKGGSGIHECECDNES